jgi:hypothetical protein
MYHLIEDYTEIFYVTDKGDIRFFQYKMSLRGPKSVRKVDGPSLTFVECYVPALTPRLKKSGLLYDGRFTASQFLLFVKPLEIDDQRFFN